MSRSYAVLIALCLTTSTSGEDLRLQLQSQQWSADRGRWITETQGQSWDPAETAIVVCDVWDLHHCLNAVRRLEQFAPQLNEVLTKARSRGVTIVHSPSDCMDFYADHPARRRAQEVPRAASLPHDVQSWCSVIPAEEQAVYPIDQSDGGEDDDPAEHAEWVAKLKSLGRSPGTPWKSQNKLITIDGERDYISDRGDEVWNILESRGIRNVILTGVHLNMCVLGRPFGLRQMVRNGKNVVLMRDMTDTMYNPKRWPYVSHIRGTALVVSHVERYVCPTITSSQFTRGAVFRMTPVAKDAPGKTKPTEDHWTNMRVPGPFPDVSQGIPRPGWLRCVVRIPARWSKELKLHVAGASKNRVTAWLNGTQLERSDNTFRVPTDAIQVDDANLLVLRISGQRHQLSQPPELTAAATESLGPFVLGGRWQFRDGDDPAWSNIPLPAKFGGSTDNVFEPEDPLFVARPLTRSGEFTMGIEGPACDALGNIYAVNYGREGTIGIVTPRGAARLGVRLPSRSVGNGIRFGPDGSYFVADYTGHNVLKVDPKTSKVTVHAHNGSMNQPNDLAIAADGTLYASDPNWQAGTGQLWRIDTDGTTTQLARMGTTNGIEVSPDGRTLYVNESRQRNIWAFTIKPDKSVSNKRLLRKFDDYGFDGMRCDVSGNLYVTRHGKGTVVKLSPEGKILREIKLPGTRPTNICFGGPDGRTAYVTEVDFTRIVTFRVDEPGLAWSRHRRRAASAGHSPMIVGHRGASRDAPENTLAAFRLAFARGADAVEGDFHLTKDGHIVCIHDADTRDVADKNLKVRDSTLADLRKLDVGRWKGEAFAGERIPTLDEVLGVIPPHGSVVIELKVGPEIVGPLRDRLKALEFPIDRCLVISFDKTTIAATRKLIPDIRAHWLSGYDKKAGTYEPGVEAVARTLQRSGANGFGSNANPNVFDEEFIAKLRSAGFGEFHVWTVNDPLRADYYRRQGAWGITTDRPGYIRRQLSLLQEPSPGSEPAR